MANSSSSSSSGIGFTGLLTIVFIVLKLTNVIDWSWWLVLSPLWIAFGILAVIAVVLGIIYLWARKKNKHPMKRTTNRH